MFYVKEKYRRNGIATLLGQKLRCKLKYPKFLVDGLDLHMIKLQNRINNKSSYNSID